jgi:O-antigen/teichoic acid export membrane protein
MTMWACAAAGQVAARFVEVEGGGTLLLLASAVAMAPVMVLPEMRATRRSVGAVVVAMLAASAVLALLREPLVSALYAHGVMDYGGQRRIMHLVPYALAATAPLGALGLLERVASPARQRAAAGLGALVTAAAAAMLVRTMGLEGVALATGAGMVVAATVLAVRKQAT